MLQKKEPITVSEFNKGLFTKGNILINEKGHSPNCMDIKWNFDGSIQKRPGCSLRGFIDIGTSSGASTGGWILDSGNLLSASLKAYWKLDETSGTRLDEFGNVSLNESSTTNSDSGVRSLAAQFVSASSNGLYGTHGTSISTNSGNFALSSWVYLDSTSTTIERSIITKQNIGSGSVDAQTVLLLHCDGADASTNFVDSSLSPKTIGTDGNVQIDTAQSKFGGASGLLDGTGDRLTVADSNDWDFGTGDWTVDFWIRFNAIGTFVSPFAGGTQGSGYYTELYGGNFYIVNGVATKATMAWAPNTATWYHVAFVRNGTNGLVFVDGSMGGAIVSDSTDYQADNAGFFVGARQGNNQNVNGWIDEFRVSKGIARWTSNFTPETKAYGSVSNIEYGLVIGTDNIPKFSVSSSGTAYDGSVVAASHGALNTSTWYNLCAWHTTGSHIGISVNQSVNTASYTSGVLTSTSPLSIGFVSGGLTQFFDGRIDEVAFWQSPLVSTQLADLYGGGSGNTYSGEASAIQTYGWGMFDFGATNLRWLTVGAGTGIYASSDMGLSWVTIGTGRTSYYQGFERSKNVLICTSDRYDPTLYWAGSAGTYASTLAPGSAPLAKFSINYKGFLILLNSTAGKRRFHYQDESTQLTAPWVNYFDLPSSADDEITNAFVINRILFVSTRYRIFKLSYVGGNPDWSYDPVQEWGFVARTVKRAVIKGIPYEVVIGLDWAKHLRVFDGFGSQIVSENIESDNEVCEFAMSKVSYFGSGIAVSNAEFDPLEQEYRLNVAIGPASTQTTHAIIFNARTLAMYPYQNQTYQAMCVAESSNRQFLMAINRSAQVFIMNTGNTDAGVVIDEIYDSPFFFSKVPGMVNKGDKLDLFFRPTPAGNLYFQDRADFNNSYGNSKKIISLNTGSYTHQYVAQDVPSTHNVYQYRLMSSGGTTDPWILTHSDLYQQNMGIGKGQ